MTFVTSSTHCAHCYKPFDYIEELDEWRCFTEDCDLYCTNGVFYWGK